MSSLKRFKRLWPKILTMVKVLKVLCLPQLKLSINKSTLKILIQIYQAPPLFRLNCLDGGE